nr:MAG TPA: hypothetical protein [Caudoviricetes sp.]
MICIFLCRNTYRYICFAFIVTFCNLWSCISTISSFFCFSSTLFLPQSIIKSISST